MCFRGSRSSRSNGWGHRGQLLGWLRRLRRRAFERPCRRLHRLPCFRPGQADMLVLISKLKKRETTYWRPTAIKHRSFMLDYRLSLALTLVVDFINADFLIPRRDG